VISEWIYRLATRAYFLSIRLAAPFSSKASDWLKGRKLEEGRQMPARQEGRQTVWIHCASLGEFEQARPLIEGLKHSGNYCIVLSFFSPSGYQTRKGYPLADVVTYIPEDNPRKAKQFLKDVSPDLAIFIKYEFWHFHIRELHERGIPILLAAGIFRKEQVFFKWYGGFFRRLLRMFHTILVQNENSLHLLREVGIDAEVVPDLRFDRVFQIAGEPIPQPAIQYDHSSSKTLVAGSTWPEDDKLLSELFQKTLKQKGFKLIVAPHQTDKQSVGNCCAAYGIGAKAFSDWQPETGIPDVLVIDHIGQLAYLYRLGKFAYVGGAFGAGLHNTLEAAVYGIPVFFGPSYQKFNEAVEMAALGSSFPVTSHVDMGSHMERLLDSDNYEVVSIAIIEYMRQRKGGTQRTLKVISSLLGTEAVS
jgi:3-deoxy-D-manno-octulosonic-acid transferase